MTSLKALMDAATPRCDGISEMSKAAEWHEKAAITLRHEQAGKIHTATANLIRVCELMDDHDRSCAYEIDEKLDCDCTRGDMKAALKALQEASNAN
jgi:hypothetical protein